MIYVIPMILKLKSVGVRDIKLFRFKNWHHGFAYFIGIYDDKKVFVKFDTKFHLLCNDKLVYEICKPYLSEEMVDILASDTDCKIEYIVYEFIEDSIELNEQILIDNPNYIEQIIYILNTISSQGIIHRDIKLDNFLVVDNKLKIIDFTFAISENFKDLDTSISDNCYTLEFLGMGLNPKPFVWDDYYSITQILSKIELKSDNNRDIFKKWRLQASSMIGKFQYKAKCKSNIYFYKRNLKIKLKEALGKPHNYREIVND